MRKNAGIIIKPNIKINGSEAEKNALAIAKIDAVDSLVKMNGINILLFYRFKIDLCQLQQIKKTSSVRTGLIAVGETGFEPATPWSQTRCATGLRYSPNISSFQFLPSGEGEIRTRGTL